MTKPFYKHKLLLDEHLEHRRAYPQLNKHFDVKHIADDLHHAGIEDAKILKLALAQGRIILTHNVKDFKLLLNQFSPGLIGIPEMWTAKRIDTKLTALFIKHSTRFFKGRYRSLAEE